MSPHPSPTPEPVFLGRWFTGARREGFLTRLSPDAWHTLCAILSFTTGQGIRSFGLDQLAVALGVPRVEAEARLAQLADTTWKSLPLLSVLRDPAGAVCGAELAPIELFARLRGTPVADEAENPDVAGTATGDLSAQLAAVGLNPAQIASLRTRFSLVEIRRQLSWLPARSARNPAALLIRAIEQGWDEPKEGA